MAAALAVTLSLGAGWGTRLRFEVGRRGSLGLGSLAVGEGFEPEDLVARINALLDGEAASGRSPS